MFSLFYITTYVYKCNRKYYNAVMSLRLMNNSKFPNIDSCRTPHFIVFMV